MSGAGRRIEAGASTMMGCDRVSNADGGAVLKWLLYLPVEIAVTTACFRRASLKFRMHARPVCGGFKSGKGPRNTLFSEHCTSNAPPILAAVSTTKRLAPAIADRAREAPEAGEFLSKPILRGG